ncbi:hypothetical protein ACFL6I_14145 [candidate division KSB1 bacterium]
MCQIEKDFIKDYAHLIAKGLEVKGVSTSLSEDEQENPEETFRNGMEGLPGYPERCVLSVQHPLIWDHSWLPDEYKGVKLSKAIGKMPKEFTGKGVRYWYQYWAPKRFEALVDRCFEEIKEFLEKPDATREEILDALAFGDFEEHKKKNRVEQERIKNNSNKH